VVEERAGTDEGVVRKLGIEAAQEKTRVEENKTGVGEGGLGFVE